MPAPLNLIGQRFGRLTVIAKAENSRHRQTRWSCACECGNEVTVIGHLLRSGNTMSCGCARRLSPYADKMRGLMAGQGAPRVSEDRVTASQSVTTLEIQVNPNFIGALDGWRSSSLQPTTRKQAAETLLAAALKLLAGPAQFKKDR